MLHDGKANPSGNKGKGLDDFEKMLAKATAENDPAFKGVKVPKKQAITHKDNQDFLLEQNKEIFIAWGQLRDGCSKAKTRADKAAFMDHPEVKAKLQFIREEIQKAFSNQDAVFTNPAIDAFLQSESKNYLMVRSSGNEDSATVVNAGGNLSEKYISPNKEAVLRSNGNVLASYFEETSLKSQIDAGGDPFAAPLQLSVLLHSLVGEVPISSSSPKTPPKVVSGVAFTTRPDISQGTLRVTMVSSAPGHGETVVESKGKTDTTYVVNSSSNPNEMLEVYLTQIKPQRLAPHQHEDGSVPLEPTPNSKDIAESRSLSPEMIQRIVNLCRAIERRNGYIPKDLEFVVKNNIIYIVQMRDIKLVSAKASYLSDAKLAKATSKPISQEPFVCKTLVPGKCDLRQATSADEILVCDTTLLDADTLFSHALNKEIDYKFVVVAKDERGALSHASVNFSGRGIPCFYADDLPKVKSLISKMDAGHSLIACPQSGRLALWDNTQSIKDFRTRGYFSYPAPIGISLAEGEDASLTALRGQKMEMPKELSDAIFLLTLKAESKKALEIIGSLQTQETSEAESKTAFEIIDDLQLQVTTKFNLKGRIKTLEEMSKGKEVTASTQAALNTLKKLDELADRTFAKLDASYRNEEAPPLERLLHIKVLETLLQGGEEGLNTFTFLHVDAIEKSVQQRIDYQEDMGSDAKYLDLLYVGNMGSSEQSAAWNTFLRDLEKIDLGAKQQQFKNLLETLSKFDALPTWYTLVFLPAHKKNTDPLKLITALLKDQQALAKELPEMQAALADIQEVKNALAKFADPNTFESGFEKFEALANKFSNINPWLESESELVRLLAYNMQKKYSDTADEATKSMKGSTPLYRPRETVRRTL